MTQKEQNNDIDKQYSFKSYKNQIKTKTTKQNKAKMYENMCRVNEIFIHLKKQNDKKHNKTIKKKYIFDEMI